MIKIKNEVYQLKKTTEVAKDVVMPEGQVFEVVMDVVYVNGHMVAPPAQPLFYNWITGNPDLFKIITKKY